jgi:hypothetical protein
MLWVYQPWVSQCVGLLDDGLHLSLQGFLQWPGIKIRLIQHWIIKLCSGLHRLCYFSCAAPHWHWNLLRWFDLQMSVSTVSTKHFARSETPSSILSSDSDIRFTRKLGVHYRCGCCILAGFLLFLLLAAAAVYLGRKYFYMRAVC